MLFLSNHYVTIKGIPKAFYRCVLLGNLQCILPGNSPCCLAMELGAELCTPILLFLAFFVQLNGFNSQGKHAIMAFNHGLPCYAIYGPRAPVMKKSSLQPCFLSTCVPWAMFFNRAWQAMIKTFIVISNTICCNLQPINTMTPGKTACLFKYNFFRFIYAVNEGLSAGHEQQYIWHRADSRFAPSQWEMSLQGNAVSHWLDTSLQGISSHGCIR